MPSIISFVSTGVVGTTNSFSTIQPDFGTSPQASSPTDTLTFTSSDGSVTITGNSGTDTINFQSTTTPLTAQYVTLANDATLPNERVLTGTANQVIITDNGAGSTVVLSLPQSIGTGSSPTFAGLTIGTLSGVLKASAGVVSGSATTSDLTEGSNLYFTDERAQDAVGTILTDSSTIDFTYNDAGNTITAAVITNTSVQKVEITKNSGAVVGTRKQLNLIEGTNITLTITDDNPNDQVDIKIDATGSSGAPANAQYVTLALDGTLTNERVLTGTTNQVIVTDNGAGSTVVLSTPQDIATVSTPTFQGINFASTSNVIDFVGRVIAAKVPTQYQTVTYLTNGFPSFIEYYNSSTFVTANRLARIDMSYDAFSNPTVEVWKIYDTDGSTVLRTYTYTYTFLNNIYTQSQLTVA